MEIIVGKSAGFCYGVERAVEGAKKELDKTNKKVYCLGEIVHNREVVEELKNKGIEFIKHTDEIKDKNSLTIIRAHGIPKEIYETCIKKNIQIADYTCPNVLKIHDIAKNHKEKGDYIILVGSSKHPENIGTISFCGKKMSVIEGIEDVAKVANEIEKSGNHKCLMIAQTTYNLERFKEIEEKLKQQLPKDIELKVQNTICMATELRQKETKELSKQVDNMIIIGGKNSSNTKKLYEVACKYCQKAICIETKDELKKQDIEHCNKIGIMAGASTPKRSIEETVEKIKNIENN